MVVAMTRLVAAVARLQRARKAAARGQRRRLHNCPARCCKRRCKSETRYAAEDEARAAAIAPPPQLMLDGPGLWLTNCDGPGAQPARNAAHDEFNTLHLLWHNTGLGAQCALFELHHCDNTPEQREALIKDVKREVEAATATKTAAQPGIAQRYRELNNDQQRLYVCACCGERNKEATGKYIRVPLSALRYKRVSVSREKLSPAAVFEPQRSTLNDKTAQLLSMSRLGAVRCA